MITDITLVNWFAFRGEHTLRFDAGAHAVIAKHKRDAKRSNWLGKTTFLHAPLFALYGKHPARLEDGFITPGETYGAVHMTIDLGGVPMRISRTRHIGKSTQLGVSCDTGDASKGEAQSIIDNHVGLSYEDMLNSCFFKQKRFSHFATCDPSTREQTIVSWFRLEKLQAAQDSIAADMKRLSDSLNEYDRRIRSAYDGLEMAIRSLDIPLGVTIAESVKNAEDTLITLSMEQCEETARVAELMKKSDARLKWDRYQQKLARYNIVIEAGKKVKGDLESIDRVSLQSKLTEYQTAYDEHMIEVGKLDQETSQIARVSLGSFKMECPIMREACPASKEVHDKVHAKSHLLEGLKQKRHESEAVKRGIEEDLYGKKNALSLLDQLDSQLSRMRNEANALRLELLQDREDLQEGSADDIDEAERAKLLLQKTEERCAAIKQVLKQCKSAQAEVVEWEKTREGIANALQLSREASVIAGRNGAQKRLAAQNIQVIEQSANKLLRDSEIDLMVTVKWERETGAMAKHCDACGNPLPKSTAIKRCPLCGEERGMHQARKLILEQSKMSGAADDISGGAFQIAASKWLRADRAAAWDVALIDEPFGALDAANSRQLANAFASMLSAEYAFAQSFVVAHNIEIMNVLPRRVEIVGDDNGSTIEVL